MTPAVRRWLLDRAEVELADAEDDERHCQERLRAVASQGLEASLAEAQARKATLQAAIGELSAGEPRVHILEGGAPLCRFSDKMPAEWPDGHRWVHRSEPDADCPGCLRASKGLGASMTTVDDVKAAWRALLEQFSLADARKAVAGETLGYLGKILSELLPVEGERLASLGNALLGEVVATTGRERAKRYSPEQIL